jgi:hypothetical protein
MYELSVVCQQSQLTDGDKRKHGLSYSLSSTGRDKEYYATRCRAVAQEHLPPVRGYKSGSAGYDNFKLCNLNTVLHDEILMPAT